jgi:hypothetical protein
MPFNFAERLFDATRMGLRVIIAPSDLAPIEIAHPVLFQPKPDAVAVAAARSAEAAETVRKADQARSAAMAASRESARAMMPVRVAENLKLRAEAQLATAETALGSAISPEAKEQAESAKAKAVARIAELEVQWANAKAELQPKLDAVIPAREALAAAEAARQTAAEAARQVARESEPVSVFISRKTQRLYVRRAFEPILDIPITIQDADRPVGTHVFTAMERNKGETNMRWSVVSLNDGHPRSGVVEPQGRARVSPVRDAEPIRTDPGSAKTALDRIVIPPDELGRIAAMASPRSSLIISDEALSAETGKGTDFVVLLSGEPQGGIKRRRRTPAPDFPYARSRDRSPYWRLPVAGPYSTW